MRLLEELAVTLVVEWVFRLVVGLPAKHLVSLVVGIVVGLPVDPKQPTLVENQVGFAVGLVVSSALRSAVSLLREPEWDFWWGSPLDPESDSFWDFHQILGKTSNGIGGWTHDRTP